MTKNLKTCFVLSICLILFLPGIVVSEEIKKENKKNCLDKAQIKKELKYQSGLVIPRAENEYSMKIFRPNPNIDDKIIKNTFDPNIDYKLRIINPYTKKEITGYKGPFFGFPLNKIQPEGEKYETPTSPIK